MQPSFESGLGTESSVDEHPGNMAAHNCSLTSLKVSNNTTYYITCCDSVFVVCVGGRMDVVFLVPASTDRINLARPLRSLLTSVARSLHTVGERDSQVPLMYFMLLTVLHMTH